MSDEHDQEDQPGLTYGEAWEIQRTVGPKLNHHEKCSSVPGHHPLSGPALLCDCGVIERFWNHQRFTKLQRELAEALEWKERYERLNESLAKNKRLFSSALSERIIDEQLQRIRQLESLYSEMQKEYHELKETNK